jgi:hypothetical protein
MKRILYVLGLAILISGIYTSCKKDSLLAMQQKEGDILDQYVKDNNLAQYKDDSGIYIKLEEPQSTDSIIIKGFKVMLQYNIMTMNNDTVFSTEDKHGHTYEEDPFYVDIHNTAIDARYVQQIAGMHIGLKKMRIGDRAFMIIPSELAFKALDNTQNLGIPRFSTLLVYVYAKSGYLYSK